MSFPEFPESLTGLEEAILDRWRGEDLFRRTLETTADGEEFVFYEGPPTANGRPGLHHLVSRTLKDLVCRYQTMRGRHVTRIAGWDTHGLPVEIEAEKKLGISGKRDIERVGVDTFNRTCRESVFTYKEEWEELSERIGYWLDYSAPYVTFEPDYIESVWWVIGQLHQRNLLYRGHKSVPYCPRCGTALSSHEVAQGYEEVSDPSITFTCPLLAEDGESDPEGREFLVWTTTPWTLPANVALAVHADLEYAEVEWEGRRLILAAARVAEVIGEDAEVLRTYRGTDLVGSRYLRPFDIIDIDIDSAATEAGAATATVIAEEFVSADDGTGIVHLAPAFGADDYEAGQRHDLPLLRPVDDTGSFVEETPLVGGLFIKDADPVLVEDLRKRERVFHYTEAVHSYPHCWRCSSPLIYMARDSWYVRTTEVKEQMLQNNAGVNWYPPDVGSGRFGEWLEGNVDWALSRDRYWGTPLPVWLCDRDPGHFEVIDSFEKLGDRAGGLPEDFDPHKPGIDRLTWPCPECAGEMHRTPEVIDVWFDSGSMPYAQYHYPFENRSEWKAHFPADFICEGIDQTRGWFYSLMAISTMLELGPAYRNVMVNDMLLDAEGRKMSKSRGNAVDPWEALETHGADPIRWYLLTVSHPWTPKRFDPDALGESTRRTFDTLANTYRFLTLYANLENWKPADADPPEAERPVMDRWVLSRLQELAADVGRGLDEYDVTTATRRIADFVADDLSNWYVRRSRPRFWGDADRPDARAAFRTLHEVLTIVARLMAPFTPFFADWLHRALQDGDSVHLAEFPGPSDGLRDRRLESDMSAARMLSSLGRAAREEVQVRVRQPLRAIHAALPGNQKPDDAVLQAVREELNVKQIHLLDAAEQVVELKARPNYRALGPRFGAKTESAAAAIRALPSESLEAFVGGSPLRVEVDGAEVEVSSEELDIEQVARGELVVHSEGGYTVALDAEIDEELRLEGTARELVNRIQRLRRDTGLEVQDRIRLAIAGSDQVLEAVRVHGDFIVRETLAREVHANGDISEDDYAGVRRLDLDGEEAVVALAGL